MQIDWRERAANVCVLHTLRVCAWGHSLLLPPLLLPPSSKEFGTNDAREKGEGGRLGLLY